MQGHLTCAQILICGTHYPFWFTVFFSFKHGYWLACNYIECEAMEDRLSCPNHAFYTVGKVKHIQVYIDCRSHLFAFFSPLVKRVQVASNGTSLHLLGPFGPITHAPPGFLLVPESSGEYRFFINLTKLNSFILAPRFHMTNHFYLASRLHPPAWLASLDLLDTYFHIPFRRSLHKYLAVLYAGDLSFF